MAEFNTSRRDLLRAAVPIGAALAVGMPAGVAAAPVPAAAAGAMDILPDPGFALSPYLYMQFLEPLGTTDGSVEASWDNLAQRWRPDLVAATRSLHPPTLRRGGLLGAYYRLGEGGGPRAGRN